MKETFSRKLRQCKWNVASLMKCSILEKRYFETSGEEVADRVAVLLDLFGTVQIEPSRNQRFEELILGVRSARSSNAEYVPVTRTYIP